MSSTKLFSAVALLAITLSTIATIALGQAPNDKSAAALDFTGKVLVISCRNNAEAGAVVEKFSLKNIAGQQFLVGTSIDDGNAENWMKGRLVWIALNDISQITEFPDLDTYKNSTKDLNL